MAVHLIAKMQDKRIDDVLRERYPGDEGTGIVLRAAMAPAQTTVAGWAAELVATAIADFLGQLPITSRSIRGSLPRGRGSPSAITA